MWHYRLIRWITNGCLWLAIAVGFVPARAQAGNASALSLWLSREVVPELRQLLTRHPLYEWQRVQIVAGGQDGLSEAIATVLDGNLAGAGITLVASAAVDPQEPVPAGSIDALECQAGPRSDYLLQASAIPGAVGRDQVKVVLLDLHNGGQQTHGWQWRGRFSQAERRQLKKAKAIISADGSLSAPWSDKDVSAAARSLSRDLACILRPQIRTRLSLQWPRQLNLPALFADTANAARHLLGSYDQLGLAAEQTSYTIEVRVEPFRDDTWQFWLTGTPRQKGLPPLQAVTYFKADDPGWPALAVSGSRAPLSRASLSRAPGSALPKLQLPTNAAGRPSAGHPSAGRGAALDFIDVEVLDATQSDRGRSRADLQLTLRIGNRAAWPIEYAFSLSGGHFNHCIARPDYYRHERYGKLAGSVEPGASVVRRLLIENTQHRPTPLLGMRKCAGFRDLEGFEEFAVKGHEVTDFVRWRM